MARVILLALLAVAAVAPGNCATSQRLTLFLDYQNPPPPRVLAALKSEVERLVAPAPGSVDWKPIQENRGKGGSVRIAVIRFDGRCEPLTAAQTEQPPRRWVLGSTLVSGGRVLPFMSIECDRVRTFLSTHPLEVGDQAYGRALGQVIAHELYHILLGTGRHSLRGLSKSAHSPRELGRVTNDFDPEVRRRIVAALRPSEPTQVRLTNATSP